MTDKLRLILARLEQRAVRLSAAISATQDGHSIPFLEGELDEVQNEIAGVRAALAAAPQPAPVDREALVPPHDALTVALFEDAKGALTSYQCVKLADALLARCLRLPGGDETMAWAVVGRDGQLKHVTGNSRQLAQQWAGPGDSIERVAFRRVEGGDDA